MNVFYRMKIGSIKEKIKKVIKPFLVVIIIGFTVSILWISLANRDIKKELKEGIKLPKISGYNYSDLKSKIRDLESRVDDLESRIDNVESKSDDNESNINDLESQVNSLESQIRRIKEDIDNLESRVSDLEDKIKY